MKKTMALLLAAALLCLLVACQAQGSSMGGGADIPLPGEEEESLTPLVPLPAAGLLNPLTGLPMAEGAVAGQRPVAVMIGNDQQSLPQRGLAVADVLLEAQDERGGTSLMAMYGDPRVIGTTGPVRYTRDQFVQFVLPSNAVLAHIGGSAYSKNLLNVLAYQDVDGMQVGTATFVYDPVRATTAGGDKRNEHNWFTDGALIAAGGAAVGLSQTGEVSTLFQFAQTPPPQGTTALDIHFAYNPFSEVSFHYNVEENTYIKTAFGVAHTDENGTPYLFQNVLLLYCTVGLKDDGIMLEYGLNAGTGSWFAGGVVYPISWQKGTPAQPLRVFDETGQEIQMQTGKTYIGLLPEAQLSSLRYVDQAGRDQAQAAADAAQAAADAAAAQAAADAADAQAAADAAAAQAAADAAAAAAPPPA